MRMATAIVGMSLQLRKTTFVGKLMRSRPTVLHEDATISNMAVTPHHK